MRQESVADKMGSSYPTDSLGPKHSSGGKVANPANTGICQVDFQIKSLLILRCFPSQGLSKIVLVHLSAAKIPGQFPQFAEGSPGWISHLLLGNSIPAPSSILNPLVST